MVAGDDSLSFVAAAAPWCRRGCWISEAMDLSQESSRQCAVLKVAIVVGSEDLHASDRDRVLTMRHVMRFGSGPAQFLRSGLYMPLVDTFVPLGLLSRNYTVQHFSRAGQPSQFKIHLIEKFEANVTEETTFCAASG